jgi:hypothetical protein
VVERFAALPGRLDVDLHLLAHRLLAEVFGQLARADAGFRGLVFAGGSGSDDAVFGHAAMVACGTPHRMRKRRIRPGGQR